jgi:hypothetical protein
VIAPVVGTSPHILGGIDWNSYEQILNRYTLIAHATSFREIRGTPVPFVLANTSLQSISSSGGLIWTFGRDGTFSNGSAVSTTTSHDATRDKVTTTSWSSAGTWSVAGNVLTMKYRKTKIASVMILRIVTEQTEVGTETYLGAFDLSISGEIRLQISK